VIHIDVRLIPPTAVVRPGERIAYSLVNRGATLAMYGEAFRIERSEDDRWVLSGPERHFRAWGRTLRPGEQVELSAPIHGDALPGRYRVTKGIVVNPVR
jgi:Big-like domain-containing protein